jgi:hypothetical protein
VKRLVLLVALVACKERGTVAIGFTGDPCATPNSTVVVYAEPNLSCELNCECGACFAAKRDGVIVYDSVCDGIELDLHPGHWAVVMAVLDAGGDEIAQGCVDIDVAEDGTGSSTKAAEVLPVSCP